MTLRPLTPALALTLALLACEADDGTPADTDAATDTDAGTDAGTDTAADASAGTGDTGGDHCQAPQGATVLADWAVYGAPTSPGDGTSVLREIAFDSTTMYFRADAQIYALDRAGGTATSVFTCPGDLGVIGCSLAPVDPDTYVVLTENGVVDATGAAIAYPAWADTNGNPVPPTASIVLPNGDRIGRYDQLDDSFVPTTTDWVRLSPGAAMAESLVGGVGGGGGRGMVYGAGVMWTNAHSLGGGNRPDPDDIWKVDFGGDIGPISIDKPGELLLVADNYAYFIRDRADELGERGVWRAPVAGGSAERVGGIVPLYGQAVASGGTVAFEDAGTLYSIDDTVGAAFIHVLELPVTTTIDHSCTVQGLAIRDGEIYSSLFDEAHNEALVFKVAVL